MKKRSSYMAATCATVASLFALACGGSGSVYVGVAAPGPWYGYPTPGMYPGGGVWVGVPVCCEDADAMAEPAESGPRYAEARDVPAAEGQSSDAMADRQAATPQPAVTSATESEAKDERGPGN